MEITNNKVDWKGSAFSSDAMDEAADTGTAEEVDQRKYAELMQGLSEQDFYGLQEDATLRRKKSPQLLLKREYASGKCSNGDQDKEDVWQEGEIMIQTT